jgi:hypothetical protein
VIGISPDTRLDKFLSYVFYTKDIYHRVCDSNTSIQYECFLVDDLGGLKHVGIQ